MAFDYKEETIADLEEKCTNYAKDSAQIAKQCEEYRQRCDRLSVIKERHERTIEELKKNGERLGSELLSKESVTKELRRFGEKLTSELASQKQIIVQLERKMNQVSASVIRVTWLPSDVTEAQLHKKFSSVGPVLSIRVFPSHSEHYAYADVQFQRPEDAERAIDTFYWDNMYANRMDGQIHIWWSPDSADGQLKNRRRLQIYGMDENFDYNALRQHFEKFGRITKGQVRPLYLGVNVAFVLFENPEDADKAFSEMNGKAVGSRRMTIYR